MNRAVTTDLTPEENERIRAAFRQLVDDRFGGSRTRAAKALGIKQPTISVLYSGQNNFSFRTARAVAEALKVSIWELLWGQP